LWIILLPPLVFFQAYFKEVGLIAKSMGSKIILIVDL